ncbi:DUF7696 family protein [Paraburkholderia acidisoli]|uniref:Uncharacterized protein n=1 Tax=Paraburkholderia acidisoli TaxID=2571748 RepID=A0A7Z2GSA7_9BURK|nr:hypothetical protein [Paraburkholderia acidisoli]QGZ67033.1 hypothetical protein FAZ98_34970 [Paraburkholderia acidisoli]
MLLSSSVDQRIADTISSTIESERATNDTTTRAWRARCEVAQIAMLADGERRVVLSHIATHRGEAAASNLAQSASQMRTSAIFILARKPS